MSNIAIPAIVLAIAITFASCATEPQHRYFTDEEDAQLKQMCEPAGCVTVPKPLFERIILALNKAWGKEA